MVRTLWLLWLLLLVLLLTACDNPAATDTCAALGVCAERAEAPEQVDILCDRSVGSSCEAAVLERTVSAALERVSARPGSRIRLWAMGETAANTKVIAERSVPKTRPGSDRSRRSQLARAAASTREVLLVAMRAIQEGQKPRGSPIAESLSRIAMSDGSERRWLIVVTDARERSALGDFECSRLPSARAFVSTIRGAGLLLANQLEGFDVEFVFVQSAPLPHRGCVATVARELQIREIWSAAIRGAGAATFRVTSGPPTFEETNEPDGLEKVKVEP